MQENVDNCDKEKMSPEVFQRKLWTWLEERGVFLEMKTQLRRQMIDVLKSSEIGQTVSNEQKSKRRLSPKYKAVNLLIAEYLLQQGYQYALSIFSVEDPTLSILPEHLPKNITNSENKDVVFKFVNDDIWDILETLGFSKDSEEVKNIYDKYTDLSSKDSFIICLIRSLAEFINKMKKDSCKTKKITKNEYGEEISNEQTKTISTQTFDRVNHCDETKSYQMRSSELMEKELHQKMQIAFDQELEIMRAKEQKKYLNNLKNIEFAISVKLKKEKEKAKERENQFKNNMAKEFEVEFLKMQEKERYKEIENEKNLQKDLEVERQKLLEEYRSIAQNKNLNSSTLMELQQASLEAAIKAVQHQSNRLRKKENLLDKKLLNIAKQNFIRKVDFESQFSGLDNEKVISYNEGYGIKKEVNPRIFQHKAIQTIEISNNTIACQKNTNEEFSGSKKIINGLEPTSQIINDLVSVHCQTELTISKKNHLTHEKCVQTLSNDYINQKLIASFKDIESSESCKTDSSSALSQKNEINNKNTFSVQSQIVTSAQNLLKSIQNENISLKSQTQQQQIQIKDLLKKQSEMNKEVSEARLEAQELSNQLLNLEKIIDVNCKSPVEQEESLKKISSSIVKENFITKSKIEKDKIKFTDKGLEKIKETLKMLEHEGEELDKSYREFKLKQLKENKSAIIPEKQKSFYNNSETRSSTPSSSLLKHLKDIRKSREKYQDKDIIHPFDSLSNSDYICNFYINDSSQNKIGETGRAFQQAMNFDQNILQNYITITKDISMYNAKNPKAFADMLKKRQINVNGDDCNTCTLKSFNSINSPKVYYSTRNPSKLLINSLTKDNIAERTKYKFQSRFNNSPNSLSNNISSIAPQSITPSKIVVDRAKKMKAMLENNDKNNSSVESLAEKKNFTKYNKRLNFNMKKPNLETETILKRNIAEYNIRKSDLILCMDKESSIQNEITHVQPIHTYNKSEIISNLSISNTNDSKIELKSNNLSEKSNEVDLKSCNVDKPIIENNEKIVTSKLLKYVNVDQVKLNEDVSKSVDSLIHGEQQLNDKNFNENDKEILKSELPDHVNKLVSNENLELLEQPTIFQNISGKDLETTFNDKKTDINSNIKLIEFKNHINNDKKMNSPEKIKSDMSNLENDSSSINSSFDNKTTKIVDQDEKLTKLDNTPDLKIFKNEDMLNSENNSNIITDNDKEICIIDSQDINQNFFNQRVETNNSYDTNIKVVTEELLRIENRTHDSDENFHSITAINHQKDISTAERDCSDKTIISHNISDYDINVNGNENNYKVNNVIFGTDNIELVIKTSANNEEIKNTEEIVKIEEADIVSTQRNVNNEKSSNSDELVLSFSSGASQHSHISVPQNSDDNDSFWN